MASLYERTDSPYLWLKFVGPEGTTQAISTKCRSDNPVDRRRAKVMQAEKSLDELQRGTLPRKEEGWLWVESFLRTNYHQGSTSLERYLTAWATIKLFLYEKQIVVPPALTRAHCFEYVTWRQEPNKAIGKYRAGQNTALLELKVLRIIMREAMHRGMVRGNPCAELRIKKAPRKIKPELTADDCAKIRTEILAVADPSLKEMLSNSFEIARYQGCRLQETRLDPMQDVDLEAGTIQFRAKGGNVFTTALHPALRSLFEQLRADRKRTTWNQPALTSRQWASSKWWNFLESIGLKEKGVTFHSTRVTVVTELARNDVHPAKAKCFVGHSSTAVHEIYQRIRPDNDLSSCLDAIGGGVASPPGHGVPDGLLSGSVNVSKQKD